MSKKQREAVAEARLAEKRMEQEAKRKQLEDSHRRFLSSERKAEDAAAAAAAAKNSTKGLGSNMGMDVKKRDAMYSTAGARNGDNGNGTVTKDVSEESQQLLGEEEREGIRRGLLGHGTGLKTKREKKKFDAVPKKKGHASLFTFEWGAEDDTLGADLNPLYNSGVAGAKPLFGRGAVAGTDISQQERNKQSFVQTLKKRRLDEGVAVDDLEKGHKVEVSAAATRRGMRFNLEQTAVTVAWQDKALEHMMERDWRIFREDFDIRIQGGCDVLPLRYWDEAALPTPLVRAIEFVGYTKPSPIQRQAVPVGMQRRDLIGIAETGSGKTCAFVLPLLAYLLALPREYIDKVRSEGPLALVMAPTRELARQIDEETKRLCKFTEFRSICIVGGESITPQTTALREGREIVVGTPGRMKDCVENSFLILNQCYYVVLDEADRMIDMGFEPQVNAVLDAIGGELKGDDEAVVESQLSNGKGLFRVTAMFSATMTPEVERLARSYLRQPIIVKIGDDKSGKNKRIKQEIVMIGEGAKKAKLLDLLRSTKSDDKIIVFANMKKSVDQLARSLEQANYYCGVLHSGKSQEQRDGTLDMFRSGDINVLVATDVAARGLDIPDVAQVFNYDMAKDIETYTHRIGRTGRAGKSGLATTFVTDRDKEVHADLKTYLESCGAQVPAGLKKAVFESGTSKEQHLG
jgi:ATP-dependent RNA helicase DDX23/PRP28